MTTSQVLAEDGQPVDPIPITWIARREPLPVVGELAAGPAVPRLARQVLQRTSRGSQLRACASQGWLLVLGATEDLPWVDGVVWLGETDDLLLPTLLEPSVSPALIRAALSVSRDQLAILLPDRLVIASRPMRTVDRGSLASLAETPS